MEPSADDIKEVYAHFGRAYYFGEVLFRGLCNLYVGSRIPEDGRTTRPRVEELMNEAYGQTLGGIVTNVTGILPQGLLPRLRQAVEKRNYLAHAFWYEEVHNLASVEGINILIGELSQYSEEFVGLDEALEPLARTYRYRLGITDELIGDLLAEASREPMAPLSTQRRLKKDELVIAVYEVPSRAGCTVLVFETDDHVLWQLCDVGFGWSPRKEVGTDWRCSDLFHDLLPARVRPRPEVKKPWEYEVPFGRNALLVIRRSEDNRSFVYTLKRPDGRRRDQDLARGGG